MAQGVPGRIRPRIFLTFRHYKGGRSSAKRNGCLYPRRNPWYSLSEAESTPGHMVLSRVPRKKSPVTPPGIAVDMVPSVYSVITSCLTWSLCCRVYILCVWPSTKYGTNWLVFIKLTVYSKLQRVQSLLLRNLASNWLKQVGGWDLLCITSRI